jgi:dimethylhistidine N-methyltransferase
MHTKSSIKFATSFHRDVYQGLTDHPKHLSSKYFYDERGDKLFQDIMEMPSYYLTRAEFDIFEKHKEEICNHFIGQGGPFNIIELGAGDGKKTKILLGQLWKQQAAFKYQAVDISANALAQLRQSVNRELPGVEVETMQGTYFETLTQLNKIQHQRKILLFLGSNIGNLLHPQAIEFLGGLQGLMGAEDLLFIGFDQKKHPQKILNAYNDPQGITEAFNKNVLVRINKELGGNFNPDNFLHWEVYDPESGTARSYLVAREKQIVSIDSLDLTVSFEAWETIHTEISQKYDDATVKWLSGKAGLVPIHQYSDPEGMYKNFLFKKIF